MSVSAKMAIAYVFSRKLTVTFVIYLSADITWLANNVIDMFPNDKRQHENEIHKKAQIYSRIGRRRTKKKIVLLKKMNCCEWRFVTEYCMDIFLLFTLFSLNEDRFFGCRFNSIFSFWHGCYTCFFTEFIKICMLYAFVITMFGCHMISIFTQLEIGFAIRR